MVGWRMACAPRVLLTLLAVRTASGYDWCYADEPDACDDLLRECNFESADHLGLDLEWTPTMVRGQQLAVSLLQLATRDHCLLIRVGEMRAMGVEALPPGLTRLLTTNPPLKVGRGIRDDVSIIRTQLGVEMYGGGGRGGAAVPLAQG